MKRDGFVRRRQALLPPQVGFTLLELLVALAIFALLAAMAYGGLNSVLKTRQQTDLYAERLSQLQKVFFWLERDIEQAVDRPIRDGFGDTQPALRGVSLGDYRLELTRSGWRNPAGGVRSNLQRVAWGVDDKQLVRSYWAVLDRAQDSPVMRTVLLSGVTKLELRYFDSQQKWHESWPASRQAGSAGSAALPVAVEVTLETEREGRITRLLRVPG